MTFENVAEKMEFTATPVALFAGVVDITVGDVVLVVFVPLSLPPPPPLQPASVNEKIKTSTATTIKLKCVCLVFFMRTSLGNAPDFFAKVISYAEYIPFTTEMQ
jgi:hypothetical protein